MVGPRCTGASEPAPAPAQRPQQQFVSCAGAAWRGGRGAGAGWTAPALALALALLLHVAPVGRGAVDAGAAAVAAAAPRLLAIPDIHGDLSQLHRCLALTGLTNATGGWSGGAGATLIQTGDQVDRGEESRSVLRYMEHLAAEASVAGSRVSSLLGNHELMVLSGDYRYVARAEIKAAGGHAAWTALFAAEGELGRLLRTRPVLRVLGEGRCRTVFAHAGLSTDFLGLGEATPEAHEAAINAEAWKLLEKDDFKRSQRKQRLDLLGNAGPLWSRFFSTRPAKEVCPAVRRTLAALGATRMAVGHTVQDGGRMRTRCGGSLHLMDVGVSKAYDGAVAAWQCEGGEATALYEDGPRLLPLHNGSGPAVDAEL